MSEATAKKVAIVIGVGAVNGLGTTIAKRFARGGYRVVVSGRTAEKLEAAVKAIEAEGFAADAIVADAASEADITGLITNAAKLGTIEVAVYNTGNNRPAPSLDTSAEHFENLWRTGAYGGFLFAREAVRAMLPQGRGTLLFTGASASLRGRPNFVAFASAKAALRAVGQSFAREFGPKGIHVAHIVIDGMIDGDIIRTRFAAAAASKGENEMLNLDALAEAYWQLHVQHPSAWSQEIDLRPSREAF